ncbi:MAG: zinc-ribbon domain-containing protein [Christensenellales bacterium]
MSDKIYISELPNLLREWDWDKNSVEGLFPEQLQHKSNKKAHWICEKGHEWICTVGKRTSGQNCPYCSNRRVLVGFNDFQTLFPKLAKEWDYESNLELKPDQVISGSNKKVCWICSQCGNRWKASIQARTQRGSGCPKCARIKRGQTRHLSNLEQKGGIIDQLLLREWNYEKNGDLTPQSVTRGSNQKVWWKCTKCSGEWQAKVLNRTNGRGCPYCSNHKILVGKNDLATTHPQLVNEWDYEKNGAITPQSITYGSGKKIWWKCPLGHSYQATPLHRTNGNTNCPICNSGRQTSFAEQAFYFYIKKIYPDAINRYTEIFDNRMELDIFIPSIRLAIEYDGVFWHKNINREKIKYQYCKKNNIKLIRIKEAQSDCWDIADKMYHTDNLDDRKNLQNLIIFVLQDIELWRGTFMFHYPDVNLERDRASILNLYHTQRLECSLENTHPKLVEEWNYSKNGTLLPSMFQAGSDERVWWICQTCGNEWQASISHRASGTGCNVCYRKQNRGGSHAGAREIYQYSKEGDFIKKWDCISSASIELKINSSNISMCAKHTRPYAGGFRWEYYYADRLAPTIKVHKSRKGLWGKPILQLDNFGNIIAEYVSLNEASRKLNIDATSISKVLNGHIRKAGGYVWKVKNSD